MARYGGKVIIFARVLSVVVLFAINRSSSGAEPPKPVYYPNRINFTNDPKPFAVRVTKFVCTKTPYERTNLLLCKTVLRRNQPTVVHIKLHVPMVLNEIYFKLDTYYRYNEYRSFPVTLHTEVCAYFRNPSDDPMSRQAMSMALETMPQYMHYCPHGNTTYVMDYWLEEKFFPKSLPAGDFRFDVWLHDRDNQTLFSYQTFFSVRRRGVLKSLIEW
uniref:Uncharacterized protein n=1 Tax=Anopheles farauti TaxID=69004 RepID=A0A182QXH9_9DIPT